MMDDIDEVRRQLAQGTDVNQRDDSGDTALYYACRFGHVEMARELLGAGADATLRDNAGWTAMDAALHTAAADDLAALLSGRTSVADELGESASPESAVTALRGSWAEAAVQVLQANSPARREADARIAAFYGY